MKIDFIYENAPAHGHQSLETQFPIKNFTVVESLWGKFILCRHAAYHAETMIKSGRTIHPRELEVLASIIDTLDTECMIIDAGANVGAFCVPNEKILKSNLEINCPIFNK